MHNDLYFIRLITEAMEAQPSTVEMADLLQRIVQLGQKARFKRGYRQFLRFMLAVQDPAVMDVDARSDGLVRSSRLALLVERDGQPIPSEPGEWLFANCEPGRYRIFFETGRLIWEGDLTEADLVSHSVWPEDIRMAAATSDSLAHPAQQIAFLGGEYALCVYPGLTSGVLAIRARGNQGGTASE